MADHGIDRTVTSISSARQWSIVAALVLAEVALTFEITMIYAALPTLNRLFGDPVRVGWLVSGFMLVSASAAALGGRLGDLYGRRRVLLAALACAAAGSTLSAVATSLPGVIAGRSLQGVAACVLPLCIGLAREFMPIGRVPLVVGVIAAAAAIGSGLGQIGGGFIVDHFGWQAMFRASAALALAAALAVVAAVPADGERRSGAARPDFVGGILFVPAVAGLLYAVDLARHAHGSGWHAAVLAACSVLVLSIWYLHERRRADPMFDVRMASSGQVAIANVLMALFALTSFQVILVASLLLQQPPWTGAGFGRSASFYGATQAPGAIAGIMLGPLSGLLAAKRGARSALIVGAAMTAVGWIGVAIYRDNLWFVVSLLFLVQAAGPIIFTNVPNLIIENVPHERTSEIVGMALVLRHASGAIGAMLVTMLLAAETVSAPGTSAPSFPTTRAYGLVSALIAAGSFAALALAWLAKPPVAPRAGIGAVEQPRTRPSS
ncbi:MAG: MFS transporter [Gammaproteobacteria bacterium]